MLLQAGYMLHDRVIRPADVGVTEAAANVTEQHWRLKLESVSFLQFCIVIRIGLLKIWTSFKEMFLEDIWQNFLPMLTCFIYLNCPFIICVWSKRHRYIDVGHPCSVLFSFLIVLVNFVTMRAWFTLFFQDPDQYDTDLYAVNIEIYIWWQLHYCEEIKLLEDVKVLWNT